MNVTSVRKISAQYHTKGGASTYLSIICGFFLLCNCSNSSQLAMEEPPKCNFFNVGKGGGCVPSANYQELNVEIVSKSEELKYTRSDLEACKIKLENYENNVGQLNTNLTLAQFQLKNHNTWYPNTMKDAYVGAGGVALGAMGLWVCQKMLGTKNKKEEHHVLELEKEVKELRASIAATDQSLAATDQLAVTASETAQSASRVAISAAEKADQAIEVASRAETASRAGVPTHIIPQQENGG